MKYDPLSVVTVPTVKFKKFFHEFLSWLLPRFTELSPGKTYKNKPTKPPNCHKHMLDIVLCYVGSEKVTSVPEFGRNVSWLPGKLRKFPPRVEPERHRSRPDSPLLRKFRPGLSLELPSRGAPQGATWKCVRGEYFSGLVWGLWVERWFEFEESYIGVFSLS